MERKCILFRTGPALLAFSLGLLIIFVTAIAVTIWLLQPQLISMAVIALVATIVPLGAMKLDKVLWRRQCHLRKMQ